jgi:hypothetical protein
MTDKNDYACVHDWSSSTVAKIFFVLALLAECPHQCSSAELDKRSGEHRCSQPEATRQGAADERTEARKTETEDPEGGYDPTQGPLRGKRLPC